MNTNKAVVTTSRWVSFIGFLRTEAYQNLRAVRLCVSDGLALQHMTSTADGRVIPPSLVLSWLVRVLNQREAELPDIKRQRFVVVTHDYRDQAEVLGILNFWITALTCLFVVPSTRNQLHRPPSTTAPRAEVKGARVAAFVSCIP